jgi:3'-phosphoadenosine 5'-phosphosulfate sulfotransferase (PAPS reductase)/FAD synthetase
MSGRVDGESVERIIARGHAEHQPIASYCLCSGGHDSTVLAHRCRAFYGELVWLDTGTAVPGVAEFMREFAAWLDKPLRVLDAGDAFRRMVLGDLPWWARYQEARDREAGLTVEAFIASDRERYGRASGGELGQCPHGFPGPAAHGRAYNRLKERQLMRLLKDTKQGDPRSVRVVFLSGLRRSESRRRAKRTAINRPGGGSAVFLCPLITWRGQQIRDYRIEHKIPESPAAALLHRSGECNCGAFAARDERAMLKALYPDWWRATIVPLEAGAQAAGIRWCRWGGYDVHGRRAGEVSRRASGPLCASCEARQTAAQPVCASRARHRADCQTAPAGKR